MANVFVLAFAIWQVASPGPAGPVFAAPAGVVFNQVHPDKTADFEQVVTRVRTALRTSKDPEQRKQADGWKVYKAAEPYQGSTLYVFMLDPALPGADYSITHLLANAAPEQVQDLYSKFVSACAAQTFWSLAPVGGK